MSATGSVYFLVKHVDDTVPASQVFETDLYGHGLSPSSLWTLSVPVVVVVHAWVSVGPMVHG